MTCEIPLNKGYVTLVDDEDYAGLAQHKWLTDVEHRTGKCYARRYETVNGIKQTILMHQVICPPGPEKQTDHRDGDGLNNRRLNLRVATVSQNQCNRGKQRNNTSGFKGVNANANRWRATIRHLGSQYHLGMFSTPEEAHAAYCKAAHKMHGEFANTGRECN